MNLLVYKSLNVANWIFENIFINMQITIVITVEINNLHAIPK